MDPKDTRKPSEGERLPPLEHQESFSVGPFEYHFPPESWESNSQLFFNLPAEHFLPCGPAAGGIISAPVRDSFKDKFLSIYSEENQLRKAITELHKQLAEASQEKETNKQKIGTLEVELVALRQKLAQTSTLGHEANKLAFVASRIRPEAQQLLLSSDEFRSEFSHKAQCNAFVMSIDIRQSTELMLRARTPEAFTIFIASLCKELTKIVLDNFGVYDKFTGDGILCFFPDFYSGPDSGYLVIKAADACQEAFGRHYREYRSCFDSIMTDVGLAIGIDYGSVHIVHVDDGITVVGKPVVYACRMARGPSGATLINQPAYEMIFARYQSCIEIHEGIINVKNQGDTVAYNIRLSGDEYTAILPNWYNRQHTKSIIKSFKDKPSYKAKMAPQTIIQEDIEFLRAIRKKGNQHKKVEGD